MLVSQEFVRRAVSSLPAKTEIAMDSKRRTREDSARNSAIREDVCAYAANGREKWREEKKNQLLLLLHITKEKE